MTGTLLWLTQNHFPQQGGMAQSCDRIVSGLRRQGWRIDLVHFSSKWRDLNAQRKLGGVNIRCPLEADVSHTLNRLWCALPHLGAESYDGVVAFGGYVPMLAGPVYAAWLQKPLSVLIRGNDFDAAVFDPKRSAVLDKAIRACARVAAVSRDKVAKIQHLWPGAAVEWVANGIDLASWSPIQSDYDQAQALRQERIGAEARLTLGMFGHIKRKKGGDYFIDALLRSGLADKAHLLVVGDMEPMLQEQLDNAPELDYSHVPFADRYTLLPYYLACDYVCIPSYYDGMPNVMLEAAALGVPMLASRAGGMADVLEDNQHGFLFEPGQTDACVAAIKRAFAAAPAHREEMADACRELAAQRLNLDTEISRYETLFREVIALEQKVSHLHSL
ncbi:glycosyltransferase family 4 protein [Hahella sp. CR1]|uniref:glycosyltransferase family 4 protein n=1 Tax=Hahella sp. CR1 TaxID=2992807 RepID=UPI0024424435|nr:glycosyltransferase family 4 protein [Hahella sp. CR1]MDG9666417.1 glycosyltransferase family 4 protein [Hahella sp. CR1]